MSADDFLGQVAAATGTYLGPMSTTYTYQGRKFELSTYVDPHPGAASLDRITWAESCGRCGGTGVYRWWTQHGEAAGTCFGCFGIGKVERSQAVRTLRQAAKMDALFREYGEQLAEEHAAHQAAIAAAELAEEVARAHEEALREQARRDAMNNAPVAEVGTRLRNVDAEVVVSTSFERDKFNGYGAELVKLVVFKLASGQVLKVVSTSTELYGLDRGDQVRVTGTVKGYGEYQGQVQTILQRVKVQAA